MFTVKIVTTKGRMIVETVNTEREIMNLINNCEEIETWIISRS